jgi:hypothetical protein
MDVCAHAAIYVVMLIVVPVLLAQYVDAIIASAVQNAAISHVNVVQNA